MNDCWVSQSGFYEVLNAVSDDVFKRKWRNNISFSIYKGYSKGHVIISRSERFDIDYYPVQSWRNFRYVAFTKHPFEGHGISVTKTIVLIWKWKTNFIWFTISSEKTYQKVHVSSPWCMHAPGGTQIFLLRQEFQNILQRELCNFFWTVVTYLLKNVKHGIEHDINSTYHGDI